MKLGIILSSNDAETVWNVFRFGTFSLKQGDEVNVFLLAKGVECESLDTEKFQVTDQIRTFVAGGGKIFACGTCLKIRGSEGSEVCPLSTMQDLYHIVRESDRLVTF
ncbi:MAG: sulfur reduction protein DsrE [Deltaproteobacteria bacterium RIFCSPHIGHO2_02_FULL_44_16]|nr:MAG: sulfur reduction protein DsrE [Deltaproteobacteria bacterium RIFCSPHIGHO2_02_FULL_44_16]